LVPPQEKSLPRRARRRHRSGILRPRQNAAALRVGYERLLFTQRRALRQARAEARRPPDRRAGTRPPAL